MRGHPSTMKPLNIVPFCYLNVLASPSIFYPRLVTQKYISKVTLIDHNQGMKIWVCHKPTIETPVGQKYEFIINPSRHWSQAVRHNWNHHTIPHHSRMHPFLIKGAYACDSRVLSWELYWEWRVNSNYPSLLTCRTKLLLLVQSNWAMPAPYTTRVFARMNMYHPCWCLRCRRCSTHAAHNREYVTYVNMYHPC
jgi:hypothetical protein